jgi:hypothetical protein
MKLRPTKQRLLLALWLAGLSISSGYAADPVEALKVCAKMADRDARFACYDELGQRVLEEESAEEQNPLESVVEAAATTTATTATGLEAVEQEQAAIQRMPLFCDNNAGRVWL